MWDKVIFGRDLYHVVLWFLITVNPDNACSLRITAAAGTQLAGAYSLSTVKFRP